MQKSAAFVWEYMFTRAKYETPDMIEQHRILTRLGELVDAGKIRSTVTDVLRPINGANLRTAHARMEEGKMIGKLVIAGW